MLNPIDIKTQVTILSVVLGAVMLFFVGMGGSPSANGTTAQTSPVPTPTVSDGSGGDCPDTSNPACTGEIAIEAVDLDENHVDVSVTVTGDENGYTFTGETGNTGVEGLFEMQVPATDAGTPYTIDIKYGSGQLPVVPPIIKAIVRAHQKKWSASSPC